MPRRARTISAHLTSLFLVVSNSSAVDTVRQSLDADSLRWFGWLIKASILVGIGVALEAPEATIALKRWYRLRKGKDVEPANEKSVVIPIAYLGLLLVVAGVAGEGIFEFLSSRSETALRAHDEGILGETESKFGQVKDSAEAAAQAASRAQVDSNRAGASAKEASDASGNAVKSSENAMELASGAKKEADSYEREISGAKQQAADAVSLLADAEQRLADSTQREAAAEAKLSAIKTPRSLINAKGLIATLKPLKGTEYTLNVFQDDESIQFTKSVDEVLREAGLVRRQKGTYRLGIPSFSIFKDDTPNHDESVPVCVETGIQIHVRSTKTLQSLLATPVADLPIGICNADTLRGALQGSIEPTEERNVVICVGKKP
jgi:hypothetical protein